MGPLTVRRVRLVVQRDTISARVLVQIGDGKSVDGARESAELGSWAMKFPCNSPETYVRDGYLGPPQHVVNNGCGAYSIDVSISE